MNLLTAGLLSVVFCAAAFAAEPAPTTQPAATTQPSDTSAFKSLKEKVSYAIGLDIGSNLKTQMIEVDPEVLLRGLRDGVAGGKPLMTEEQIHEALMALQQQLATRQATQAKEQGDKNKTEGAAFLEKNKKETGVVTTASGLQYKVLTPGKGAHPKPTDVVTVHYRGTLIDGTEFDSSYKTNEPATFPVSGVIAGWTEALQLMSPGAKFKLVVPSDLAYGPRGAGREIGPNAVLIFEVELLAIKPGDAPGAPTGPGGMGQ